MCNVWPIRSRLPANNSTKHIHFLFIYTFSFYVRRRVIDIIDIEYSTVLFAYTVDLVAYYEAFCTVSFQLFLFGWLAFSNDISSKWTKRKWYRSKMLTAAIFYWLLVRLFKYERLICCYCFTISLDMFKNFYWMYENTFLFH